MYKIFIFFIFTGCYRSTTHQNQSSVFIDVKKANFVNGEIVLADKDMSEETGICFVKIKNINYDTLWVDHNSIISDSIKVVAPSEIISVPNSNSGLSSRTDYLIRFPVNRNYILKGESKQFLFRNEIYYGNNTSDIINVYYFFADSMELKIKMRLEINSKNLTSQISSL